MNNIAPFEDPQELRQPPHDMGAEQSVLGGIMLDKSKWKEASAILSEGDFFDWRHREIWRAIEGLVHEGIQPDVVTLGDVLGGGESLSMVGAMAKNTPSAANVAAYARIVNDKSVRRAQIEEYERAISQAYSGSNHSAYDLIKDSEQRLAALRIGEPHTATANMAAYVMAADIGNVELNRTWLVQGMLEEDRVYQVFGEWKSGKSLVVMDMCCHMAMGQPWAGKRTVQSLVVWVAGESVDDMQGRIQGFMRRHDVTGGDMLFALRKRPAYLTDAEQAFRLAAEIKELRELCPDCPVVLVIDTLNRNFGPGASENSDGDMGAFVTNLIDVVARPNKAAVLVVHHSGHMEKGRGRGHSSFPAAIDGSLKVTKDGEGPEFVTIEVTEARSTTADAEARFRIDVQELPWEDNFGDKVQTPVLTFTDEAAPEAAKQDRMGAKQHMALVALKGLYEQARANLRADGRDERIARVEVNTWRKECAKLGQGDRRRWAELKGSLESRGVIKIEGPFVVLA